MDRRETLGLGLSALTVLADKAAAQATGSASHASTDSTETILLWPGVPPGGAGVTVATTFAEASTIAGEANNRRVTSVGVPLLTVYRATRPNGSALLLIPGGGYGIELMDGEGIETARLFSGIGITCFILRYRLPGDGWTNRTDVPLQDAQRALRLMRANAANYLINPARIGVIGFSAGGHLAATLATKFAAKVYDPLDAVDAQNPKPNVLALLFPLITMGDGTDPGSRANFFGPNPTPEAIAAYSCEKHVTSDTPPSFICFAADDPVVSPMANGMAMYHALRAANVASELHVFEQGGHGFGVWNAAGKSFSAWPQLFLQWSATHGYIAMTPDQAAHIAL